MNINSGAISMRGTFLINPIPNPANTKKIGYEIRSLCPIITNNETIKRRERINNNVYCMLYFLFFLEISIF